MPKLPALSARQVVGILRKLGFYENRQKGSHLVLVHGITNRRIVVPMHASRTIKLPLLRSIITDTGVPVEEFLNLL